MTKRNVTRPLLYSLFALRSKNQRTPLNRISLSHAENGLKSSFLINLKHFENNYSGIAFDRRGKHCESC